MARTVGRSPEEVLGLNLEKILEFQQQTGITQLFQITDHEFRYDIYDWEEIEIRDYQFEPRGMDLPSNVIFHVDSSGSMGSAIYVGTGSPYDTLMHVSYGILKTLVKAAQESKKQVNILSANFSNGTILSQPVELQTMYDTPNNDAKRVLTGFQAGGTVYSPDTFPKIRPLLKPGKTVHVWITDGGLESGSAPQTYREIESATADPNTSFLYFEIGTQSGFGMQMKQLEQRRTNVKCHLGVTIQQIQSQALEVMIQYDDKKKYDQMI